MGILDKLKKNKQRTDLLRKEYENIDRITHDIQRKKLSHNEREMMAILKREKENNLKEALKFEEKRRKAEEMFKEREMWKGGINLLE